MVNNIFRLSILAIFLSGAMVLITQVLSVNQLLYPIRIDSLYVQQQEIIYDKLLLAGKADSGEVFLYTPDQLNLNAADINFIMDDSVKIKGWMIADTVKINTPLLLIIPGINEGAVDYIPAMREFAQRGLNVCVIDSRGQGMSEGDYYDPGGRSVSDLKIITSKLKEFSFVENIAILGSGTGAGMIMKAVIDSDEIADVIIFQNPPKNLAKVFENQALREWGNIIIPFMKTLQREYETKTGVTFSSCNYLQMIKNIYIPNMVVAANYFSERNINESIDMYKASNYYRKRLLIDKATFSKRPGFNNSKIYYDNISAFINSSVPKKSRKSRFRKLASM